MNKIVQLKTSPINIRLTMEALVGEISRLKLNEKLLVTAMDAELQAVRDNYENRLATLKQLLSEKTEAARAWAETNAAEFGERRSIEFAHGTIGFRTGPPKLKTLVKWKWDGVLEALRAARWGAAYLRVKEEINKEQIHRGRRRENFERDGIAQDRRASGAGGSVLCGSELDESGEPRSGSLIGVRPSRALRYPIISGAGLGNNTFRANYIAAPGTGALRCPFFGPMVLRIKNSDAPGMT